MLDLKVLKIERNAHIVQLFAVISPLTAQLKLKRSSNGTHDLRISGFHPTAPFTNALNLRVNEVSSQLGQHHLIGGPVPRQTIKQLIGALGAFNTYASQGEVSADAYGLQVLSVFLNVKTSGAILTQFEHNYVEVHFANVELINGAGNFISAVHHRLLDEYSAVEDPDVKTVWEAAADAFIVLTKAEYQRQAKEQAAREAQQNDATREKARLKREKDDQRKHEKMRMIQMQKEIELDMTSTTLTGDEVDKILTDHGINIVTLKLELTRYNTDSVTCKLSGLAKDVINHDYLDMRASTVLQELDMKSFDGLISSDTLHDILTKFVGVCDPNWKIKAVAYGRLGALLLKHITFYSNRKANVQRSSGGYIEVELEGFEFELLGAQIPAIVRQFKRGPCEDEKAYIEYKNPSVAAEDEALERLLEEALDEGGLFGDEGDNDRGEDDGELNTVPRAEDIGRSIPPCREPANVKKNKPDLGTYTPRFRSVLEPGFVFAPLNANLLPYANAHILNAVEQKRLCKERSTQAFGPQKYQLDDNPLALRYNTKDELMPTNTEIKKCVRSSFADVTKTRLMAWCEIQVISKSDGKEAIEDRIEKYVHDFGVELDGRYGVPCSRAEELEKLAAAHRLNAGKKVDDEKKQEEKEEDVEEIVRMPRKFEPTDPVKGFTEGTESYSGSMSLTAASIQHEGEDKEIRRELAPQGWTRATNNTIMPPSFTTPVNAKPMHAGTDQQNHHSHHQSLQASHKPQIPGAFAPQAPMAIIPHMSPPPAPPIQQQSHSTATMPPTNPDNTWGFANDRRQRTPTVQEVVEVCSRKVYQHQAFTFKAPEMRNFLKWVKCEDVRSNTPKANSEQMVLNWFRREGHEAEMKKCMEEMMRARAGSAQPTPHAAAAVAATGNGHVHIPPQQQPPTMQNGRQQSLGSFGARARASASGFAGGIPKNERALPLQLGRTAVGRVDMKHHVRTQASRLSTNDLAVTQLEQIAGPSAPSPPPPATAAPTVISLIDDDDDDHDNDNDHHNKNNKLTPQLPASASITASRQTHPTPLARRASSHISTNLPAQNVQYNRVMDNRVTKSRPQKLSSTSASIARLGKNGRGHDFSRLEDSVNANANANADTNTGIITHNNNENAQDAGVAAPPSQQPQQQQQGYDFPQSPALSLADFQATVLRYGEEIVFPRRDEMGQMGQMWNEQQMGYGGQQEYSEQQGLFTLEEMLYGEQQQQYAGQQIPYGQFDGFQQEQYGLPQQNPQQPQSGPQEQEYGEYQQE